MRIGERLEAALKVAGAVLKRENKHRVYKLSNGQTFVTAKSPSDYRAEANALSDLRAVAGVDLRDKPHKAPAEIRAERRNRPGRAGDAPWKSYGPSSGPSTLAESLRASGVVEQKLRDALDTAKIAYELAAENERVVREKLIALEGRWYVRLGRYIDRTVGPDRAARG